MSQISPVKPELVSVRMQRMVEHFQPCLAIQKYSRRTDLLETTQGIHCQSLQHIFCICDIRRFHRQNQQSGLDDLVAASFKLIAEHVRIDCPKIIKGISTGSQFDPIPERIRMDTPDHHGQFHPNGRVEGMEQIFDPGNDGVLPLFADQSEVDILKLNAAGIFRL